MIMRRLVSLGGRFPCEFWLLYGGEPREDRWYARRYFTAFPDTNPQESPETIRYGRLEPDCEAVMPHGHSIILP